MSEVKQVRQIDADTLVRMFECRPSTERLETFEEGEFKVVWVGRLAGIIVSSPDGQWKFNTTEAAMAAAILAKGVIRNQIVEAIRAQLEAKQAKQ